MDKLKVLGVGVVVEKDNRFLIVQENFENKDINKAKGSYSLPSGHVLANESIEDAIIREVEEETGFLIKINGLIGLYDIGLALGIAFYGEIIQELNIDSHEEIRKVLWLTYDEIIKLPLRPANKEILDDYINKKTFDKNILKII